MTPKAIVIVGICTVDALGRFVETYPQRQGLEFFDQLSLATGGNAVNCAIALRKLGLPCTVIVKAGTDILGDFLVAELNRHGLDARGIIRDGSAGTPFTFVCVHRDGERSFLHTPGTNATLTLADLPQELLAPAELLLLTGTMLMPALDGEPSATLLARARAGGATTLLDTVYADALPAAEWSRRVEPCLPHLDYFLPSLAEAARLCGRDDPADCAERFIRAGCRNVIIKLGAAGAYVRPAGAAPYHVAGYAVAKTVDTTGAGDTWCAGLLAGLALGRALPAAVRLGHAVAAHGVQAVGATTGIPLLARVDAFQRAAEASAASTAAGGAPDAGASGSPRR